LPVRVERPQLAEARHVDGRRVQGPLVEDGPVRALSLCCVNTSAARATGAHIDAIAVVATRRDIRGE
jgi:hypothetical protein